MNMHDIELNAAQKILVHLGAYATPAGLMDEKAQAAVRDRAKRRTRPLLGRGNYGRNLMAHFDRRRAGFH